MTLLERVRFHIAWERRNSGSATDAEIDDIINSMTPLELLIAISEALEEKEKEQ